MRKDVLETIRAKKDVTNAIVLTHNIDFCFIQTVVLAALRACGQPTITIFADAACATESFAHQSSLLSNLGTRYRVVPVAMEPGFRFHPKAVLLSGEASATLLVGSGNLTFGGWRENAEVWLRFDSESDGVAPFLAFERYLDELLARVSLPDAIRAEVSEAFDPKSKSWMADQSARFSGLVGRVGSGNALLDRMLTAIGRDPVDELTVCTPYFDDDGVGLRELIAQINAKKTTVLCQPQRSTLTRQSWEPNAGRAILRRVDFTRKNADGEERSAFMHAKLYAVHRDHEVLVLAGSANCSRAALTVSGRAGNAELLAIRSMTHAQFQEEFLGEWKITEEPVSLVDAPAPKPDDGGIHKPALHVHAARLEGRRLTVAYSPPGAVIVACLLDGIEVPFELVEKGVLRATTDKDLRVVVVRARIDGEIIESPPAWVDHEHKLRTSARGRCLADSIRSRLQPAVWNANGWAEVLEVFCKELSYRPVHHTGQMVSHEKENNQPAVETVYTTADVFSGSYQGPSLGLMSSCFDHGGRGYILSLQQLLLRWFGIASEDPVVEDETSWENDEILDDTDETQDRPERLQVETPSKSKATLEVNKRDQRRIEKLLQKLEQSLTSRLFLEERSPDYLAADLKVASALLRLGLREGWIERKRFFELTHKVWSSLFFSSELRTDGGWVEHRANTAMDRTAFINAMQSAELSAALLGWKLGVPRDDATPEAARLELAAVLAVARLPWLWFGGTPENIAKELAILLAHTAAPGMNQDDLFRQAETEWALLQKRGQAWSVLDAVLRSKTLADFQSQIRNHELHPGDLLWQATAGYCVVRERASRLKSDKVKVLQLQKNDSEAQYMASYTIPIRALLVDDLIPHDANFGDEAQETLLEFIDALGRGFVP